MTSTITISPLTHVAWCDVRDQYSSVDDLCEQLTVGQVSHTSRKVGCIKFHGATPINISSSASCSPYRVAIFSHSFTS